MFALLSAIVHSTTARIPLILVSILLLLKSQYASIPGPSNPPGTQYAHLHDIYIWKAVFIQETVTVGKPAVTVDRFDC